MNRDNSYLVWLRVHILVRIFLMITGKTSQYFTLFFKRIAKHLTGGGRHFSELAHHKDFLPMIEKMTQCSGYVIKVSFNIRTLAPNWVRYLGSGFAHLPDLSGAQCFRLEHS